MEFWAGDEVFVLISKFLITFERFGGLKENRWSFMIRLALLALAALCFFTFRSIDQQASLQTISSVQSLLRREAETSNSYMLSKSISDLENLGIISCAKLTEVKPFRREFYNSGQSVRCRSVFQFSKSSVAELSGLNGSEMLVEYSRPRNWPLLISEILIYLFLTGFAFILPRYFSSLIREKNERLEVLRIQNESMSNLARQVSHDVASPISVLQLIADRMKTSDPEIEEVLNSTLDRTKTIFNNLKQGSVQPSQHLLNPLIERVVREKRVQWGQQVELSVDIGESQYQTVFVESANFQRMLSNILNNSFEATRGVEQPRIKIQSYASNAGKIRIQVEDNGCGIPQEFIPRLGTKDFSFGKENSPHSGSGLGLFHAKTHLEKWGGELQFESSQAPSRRGTRLILGLRSY